jgi:hypothetical protein
MEDKKFLIIDSRPYGLFSIFLHTIDNIKWAEDNDYIPVVRWGPGRRDPNMGRPGSIEASKNGHPRFVKDKNNFLTDQHPGSNNNTPGLKHCRCLYWSDTGHNGSNTPWEYYFEPLNEHKIELALKEEHSVSDIFLIGELDFDIENKFLIKNIHSYEPLLLWDLLETDRERRHRKKINEVIEKNIKIKKEILSKVDCFYDKYFQEHEKVMAVHVRGTDKKLEYPHKALPIEAYKEAIQDYLNTNTEKISLYIASDNNEAIAEIIKTFNSKVNKVIVYPATRMPKYYTKDPIHLHHSAGPKHGEEVLIEAILLSRCAHLICTDSNVSAAAMYINPHMTVHYLNRKYGSRC